MTSEDQISTKFNNDGTLKNKRHERFSHEYVNSGNASNAARQAGFSEKTAGQIGFELLKKPEIEKRISDLSKQILDDLDIKTKEVLQRHWQIATTDVTSLVEFHHCCCRYCYGKDFEYQWKTQREYREEEGKMIAIATRGLSDDDARVKRTKLIRSGELVVPGYKTDAGGYGYDKRKPPNPDCPECNGLGVHDAVIADTRKLTPEALALFEGVKVTQHGVEVKVADRQKGLDAVSRHLGLYKEPDDKKTFGDAVTEFLSVLQQASPLPVAAPTTTAHEEAAKRLEGYIEEEDEDQEP